MGRLLCHFCYSCQYKETPKCNPANCILYQTHLAQEAKRCRGKACRVAPIGKPIRWKKGNKPMPVTLVKGLEHYSTCELVEELKKREGVKAHTIEPHHDVNVFMSGPAVLLVVTD